MCVGRGKSRENTPTKYINWLKPWRIRWSCISLYLWIKEIPIKHIHTPSYPLLSDIKFKTSVVFYTVNSNIVVFLSICKIWYNSSTLLYLYTILSKADLYRMTWLNVIAFSPLNIWQCFLGKWQRMKAQKANDAFFKVYFIDDILTVVLIFSICSPLSGIPFPHRNPPPT